MEEKIVPIFDDLKFRLEGLLKEFERGHTGWMYGYRKSPINGTLQFHNGVDIPNVKGHPIFCPMNGVVLKAWFDDVAPRGYGGGNSVILLHSSGPFVRTGYCHMERFGKDIAAGMKVIKGQIVGYVDSTGASTGNHLHFVSRSLFGNSIQSIDPLKYLLESVGLPMISDHKVGEDMLCPKRR